MSEEYMKYLCVALVILLVLVFIKQYCKVSYCVCPFTIDEDYWAVCNLFGSYKVVPVFCYEVTKTENVLKEGSWSASFVGRHKDSTMDFSITSEDRINVFKSRKEAGDELAKIMIAMKYENMPLVKKTEVDI